MRHRSLKRGLAQSAMAVAILVGLGGCQSALHEKNALLMQENQELRAELAATLAEGGGASASMQASVQQELSRRDADIAALQRELQDARWEAENARTMAAEAAAAPPIESYNPPMGRPVSAMTPADPFAGIAGVTGSMQAGEVRATVASDVLFDPGRATLKSSAKQSLDAVARVITSNYSGQSIRVTGHTDADPIRKSGHKSNHHLGFERAFSVRAYLIERGVPANQVYLASHGPDRARGTKKESRRVDISVELDAG
ncbi:MAG: OmpA family protein [Phycisphaerales bacterium]|nr:OmpA family protein [Phycisphaerales bacterium]NNM27655.1 OmpA family protein [Phycisphaerales bacterium]